MKKKNGLLTLVFSCYPGGGHMYLGFMKQGLQLMLLFSGILAMTTLSRSFNFLVFLLPIFVAYSIFDASNKRNSMIEPNDSDLELFRWFNTKNTGHLKEMNYYKVGAYVLIIAGLYILFDNVALSILRGILQTLSNMMNISLYHIEQIIRSTILGIIFIIGGFKLLAQMKKIDPSEKSDDHV